MSFDFNPSHSLGLWDIVPSCSQTVLHTGELPADLAEELHRNKRITRCLDTTTSCTRAESMVKSFDCILVGLKSWTLPLLAQVLEHRAECLSVNGRITVFFDGVDTFTDRMEQIDQLLSTLGLMRYRFGIFSHSNPGANTSIHVLIAVKVDYNPVVHARQLARAGRPDWALSTLNAIPSGLIQSNNLIAGLALEKQKHYFDLQKISNPPAPPHKYFSKQRREFAQVTALAPKTKDAYHILADYWRYLGRGDMSWRVLNSIRYASNGKLRIPGQLKPQRQIFQKDALEEDALWDPAGPSLRILIITHDDPDYGMDTLYHGLCHLLGKHNVIEFPWKPTLHGRNAEAAQNYPCVFDFPGEPLGVDELINELRNGKFDLIVYADVVQMAYSGKVKQLLDANPSVPLILYDTWDDCYTPLDKILRYIGRDRFDVMFKREMLSGVDYEPHTFALPFGYVHQTIQNPTTAARTEPIFWAGKKEYGLRPLYVESLEKLLGHSLGRQYDQTTYQAKLSCSRIGLSFFGCGFDSVRYWELPANGVMLMAERPPIRIPNNFIDGQSAVFFDDLGDMEDKLDYYLHRPEALARIAAAGHSHFLEHHTTLSRARQFLGIVDRELGGRLSGRLAQHRSAPSLIVPDGTNAPIHMGLVKGENYGWGVCSRYLIDELSRIRSVRVLNDLHESTLSKPLDGKLFQALSDVNLQPLFENARAEENYGYTFFENELTRQSVENAKRFDLVLAGSTWCRDRLIERGISNCDVLIQGIDPAFFYPIEEYKSKDRFVIFSGGKFELRKGQDLVLQAVKILQEKYPDVYLLNCWFNLWPDSVRQMACSPYISFTYDPSISWKALMQRTYLANGLDPDRVTTMELVPHRQQRALFEQTDIGVFPNRCEGGTNLVLMEYMACAKPVIASYTSGHKDILSEKNALLLHQLKNLEVTNEQGICIGRWQNPSLDELVAQLEYAYHHRETIRTLGRQAGKDLQSYTWKNCAGRLNRMIGH